MHKDEAPDESGAVPMVSVRLARTKGQEGVRSTEPINALIGISYSLPTMRFKNIPPRGLESKEIKKAKHDDPTANPTNWLRGNSINMIASFGRTYEYSPEICPPKV